MKLQILDDDTILFDNSSMEKVMFCEREGQYALIEGRIPTESKAALSFGEALHLAHRIRYYLEGNKAVSQETEGRQFMALEKFWEKKPTPFGDHRTLGLAQQVIKEYNQEFKEEQFNLFTREVEGKTQRIVEESFSMPLGKVGKYKIIWVGRLDLPIHNHEGNWITDHKSTSIGGEYAMQEFFMSSQFMGYTDSMAKRFGITVAGTLVNLMVVRKPAKTDRAKTKRIEFLRQYIRYDAEKLEEWRFNMLTLVRNFLSQWEEKFTTMRTKNCIRKYGQCAYYKVCMMSPASRHFALHGTDEYANDEWSPIHSDDEIFNWAVGLKPEEVTYRMAEVQAQPDPNMPSISNLITDLTDLSKLT